MSHCRLLTHHEPLTINNTTGRVAEYIAALNAAMVRLVVLHSAVIVGRGRSTTRSKKLNLNRSSGLVTEYIVAIDVARFHFPADT